METIRRYLNRRTLISGEVKSGKTARTLEILQEFIEAGYANRIAVIDMAGPNAAPGLNPTQGPWPGRSASDRTWAPMASSSGSRWRVGGVKVATPPVLYLTTTVAAPRLTGVDEPHVRRLARQNACAIEALFAVLRRQPKDILFVNDASLYLQAGDLSVFLSLLGTASTQIINAYFGGTFKDSALTQREKRLTAALMKTCDQIINVSPDAVKSEAIPDPGRQG